MSRSDHQIRTYRNQFNIRRFKGLNVIYRDTDLWIGIDNGSFLSLLNEHNMDDPLTSVLKELHGSQSQAPVLKKMKELILYKIKELRNKLDEYILTEPFFAKSLAPFQPGKHAPAVAIDMAEAAKRAGIGPMASVAGLFAREVGLTILQNSLVNELIVENGGDIFVKINKELVLSIYAGQSPLSEKIGLVIPPGIGHLGICTSAGTVGPSFSFGRADAVVVVCRNVLYADAWATSLANEVKDPDDIDRVLEMSEKFPEILSVVIICQDKIGMRGYFEVRLFK